MPLILDSPSPEPQLQPSDPIEERRLHHEADIVIIGAGVLGCAAAITFARQGRSVILLEKSLKEPDRIVGELLQPGGVSALEKLGLRDCLEEIDAVRVQGYQVIYYGQPVSIPYPENAVTDRSTKTGKSARPEGRSFHHGRFIRRLRETAMKETNITVVETAATDMVRCGYTGQVLGVECQTNGKPDYVCCAGVNST
jgi:squalene monooxygenase